jgi:hypothetical protein
VIDGSAGGQRPGGCREGVLPRRLAHAGDLDGDATGRCHEVELPAAPVDAPRVLRSYVGVGTRTEEEDTGGGPRGLAGGVGVVGVEHCRRVRGQPGDQIAFLERDLVAAAQVLDVRRAHVGDDAHGGAGDFDQLGDLAAVVHPQLDDDAPIRCGPPQQGEGKAELVVQVPRVLETGRRHREDRGAHLLRHRLAVAPGDGDDGTGEFRAVSPRQRAERAGRVVDCDCREVRREAFRQLATALEKEARRPCGGRLGEEAVRVVVGAHDGHEELPRSDGPGVDGNAREARFAASPQHASSGPVGGAGRAEGDAHRRARRSRARSASSPSWKGNFFRPMIW